MDAENDFEGVECLKLAAFNGMIDCELPNNRLDRFNGKLVWKQEGDRQPKVYSLSNDNMLLRGTTMRNVDWAFGVVVFAGPDTKVSY
jgi:phospholipid-translocating ATPase